MEKYLTLTIIFAAPAYMVAYAFSAKNPDRFAAGAAAVGFIVGVVVEFLSLYYEAKRNSDLEKNKPSSEPEKS